MNKLCAAFQTEARRVARLLAMGERARVKVAEETLTNLLILNLSLVQSPVFSIRGYSKAEESTFGADWEMWILGYGGAVLPLRIQAKVCNPDTMAFDHLHYRKDAASPYQCDALIASAQAANPPRVPMYLLYSRPSAPVPAPWCCVTYPQNRALLACSLVGATQVRSLRSNGMRRAVSDVAPYMEPWHCLVCCSGYGGGDLAQRALGWFRARFPETADELSSEIAATPDGLNRRSEDTSLPAYVRTLLDQGRTELPDDLSGILVIQERTAAA